MLYLRVIAGVLVICIIYLALFTSAINLSWSEFMKKILFVVTAVAVGLFAAWLANGGQLFGIGG